MKCKALTEVAIVFEYTKFWFEENVEQTVKHFTDSYDDLDLLEVLNGADRLSARIEWQQNQYLFHVEHYSESVWLESVDEHAQAELPILYRYLETNVR